MCKGQIFIYMELPHNDKTNDVEANDRSKRELSKPIIRIYYLIVVLLLKLRVFLTSTLFPEFYVLEDDEALSFQQFLCDPKLINKSIQKTA